MMQIVLIGLGAGAAATLLFASVVSGSLAAIFLFYLAPLPILIAALGWSHLGRADRGRVRGAGDRDACPASFFISVSVIAFGAWWLGYLSLLARPAANGGGEAMEWYPVGRLVLWCAIIGTLIVVAAIPNFGTDQESLQAGLRKVYERILQRSRRVVDMLVVAVPPAAAVFSTLTNIFNLWLAGRIVKVSGRLRAAVARPARHDAADLRDGGAGGGDRGLVPARPRRRPGRRVGGEPADGICASWALRFCTPSPAASAAGRSC